MAYSATCDGGDDQHAPTEVRLRLRTPLLPGSLCQIDRQGDFKV
jgi:hypothetical protein